MHRWALIFFFYFYIGSCDFYLSSVYYGSRIVNAGVLWKYKSKQKHVPWTTVNPDFILFHSSIYSSLYFEPENKFPWTLTTCINTSIIHFRSYFHGKNITFHADSWLMFPTARSAPTPLQHWKWSQPTEETNCVPVLEQYLYILEKVKTKLTSQSQLHPCLVIPPWEKNGLTSLT